MHQNIARDGKLASTDAHLSLEGVCKSYGNFTAVSKLDLGVRKGELIALLGPSGCGKTTTLRMIAGLIQPSGGRIAVAGREVTFAPPYARDMGLVFQSYALFPHMTVARNVAFGLEMRKLARSEIAARVEKALDMVQLRHLAERKPRELSGGQQQRVALARALVIEPSILLLDEPLSNLDAKLRDEMRTQIRDIQQELGITTVFVTHDQVEALSMCDRVVVMRGGAVEQVGTPHEIYEEPATSFVASFVGRTNRLKGIREGKGAVRLGPELVRISSYVADGEIELMIRPHRISIAWHEGQPVGNAADGENRLTASLARITFIGDLVQYHFHSAGGEIIVEQATARDTSQRRVGDMATLSWRVEDTFAFGAER